FELHVKNQIRVGQELEFIGPEVLFIKDAEYQLYNQHGETVQQADHGKEYFIRPSVAVEQGYIIRAETEK
ncbi:MAG: U32 family peptidase C-terminal domain-containing protein, partial [Spirochaetia bacterium]